MKRSGIARNKPLARGKPLARSAPLRRGEFKAGQGPRRVTRLTPKGRAAVGLTDQVVAAVRHRSLGVCEAVWDGRRCGAPASHHHHRVLRSRGGRLLDAESVWFHLAYLCHGCHERCHADQQAGTAWFDGELLIVRGEVTARHGSLEYIGPSDLFRRLIDLPDA